MINAQQTEERHYVTSLLGTWSRLSVAGQRTPIHLIVKIRYRLHLVSSETEKEQSDRKSTRNANFPFMFIPPVERKHMRGRCTKTYSVGCCFIQSVRSLWAPMVFLNVLPEKQRATSEDASAYPSIIHQYNYPYRG